MYILIISLFIMCASWYAQWRLKNKFEKYSQIPFKGNMTGADVALKMLRDNGLSEVKVMSVEGRLTDHYNPVDKTVNLSPEVYQGASVAAAAVAAHECGHAVQHARAYTWLTMRSQMVPVVSFSSQWIQWILLGGILLVSVFPYLLLAGIVLFALTTLFSFITLPVEFDASKRALVWLEDTHMVSEEEHAQAKDALNAAASTYVIAAIGSLATLMYYIMLFLRRR